MLLVGLTGGLASGTTTVANLFQECGACVVHADQLARTVVEPGKAAWKDIVTTFGTRMLKPDRTIDREALAAVVFHEPEKLLALNRLVHPRIAREQTRQTRALARRRPDAVVIYDAALLIEARAHTRMDRVIVVTANQATQIQRARQRDGLTRKEALGRIRGQLPLHAKRRVADYLIDGTLPVNQLRPRIRRLYQELRHDAALRTRTHASPKRHA